MTYVCPSGGDRKGFGNGIIMELFWVCGLEEGVGKRLFLFLERNPETV